jgi:hypothetical protein
MKLVETPILPKMLKSHHSHANTANAIIVRTTMTVKREFRSMSDEQRPQRGKAAAKMIFQPRMDADKKCPFLICVHLRPSTVKKSVFAAPPL